MGVTEARTFVLNFLNFFNFFNFFNFLFLGLRNLYLLQSCNVFSENVKLDVHRRAHLDILEIGVL